MKKVFVILIEIAVLYMLLRSSFVQYMLAGVHKTLSDWLTEISQLHDRQTLEQLRGNMSHISRDFSESQQAYFDKITYSSEQVLRFHQLYCVKKDKNPFIYGDNLQQFCAQIEQLKSQF